MKYQFGEKLRSVRERKGLTLKEVAAHAGVTESLISQIERNKVSPAIDTLLGIAGYLEMDLEYLFQEFRKERSIQIVRLQDRQRLSLPGAAYEQLARAGASTDPFAMEAYMIEIEPGHTRSSQEAGHPGRELGIIKEGSAQLKIGGQTYDLEPGDSVSFESQVPHVLANSGKTVLKAYWIVTPPKLFKQEP